MKEYFLTASDGLQLSAARFDCENPKALIQCIHGAREHKKRYYDFIRFLNENGYAVLISDLRGHGASVSDKFPLGYMDGLEALIDDQVCLTKHFKNLYPEKPLYLFGHSLGSMIARNYLQENDAEIEKLVMTGTVFPLPAAPLGKRLCDFSAGQYGKTATKGLACMLGNVKEDRWVCGNRKTMHIYRLDPLVQNCRYTTAAVGTIVDSNAKLSDFRAFRTQNPELKILSATGAQDICSGGAVGLRASARALNKAGYQRVFSIVYPGMRHEVLNETDNQRVYHDILAFFNT